MISLRSKSSINFYNKFLGFLVKNGNRNKAKKIVDKAFTLASKISKKSTVFLLKLVFLRLSVFVESRTIRVKKKSHIVPFPISVNRRFFLVSSWLMKAIDQNDGKIPTFLKIKEEILLLLKKSPSKSLKLKQFNNKQVILNRSNAHFRW